MISPIIFTPRIISFGRTDFQLETPEPQSDGGRQEEKTDKEQTTEPEGQTEKGSVANEEEVAANLPTVDEQIVIPNQLTQPFLHLRPAKK